MKVTKLDHNRDITCSGYIIQRKSGNGRSKPVGAIYKPKIVPKSGRRGVNIGKTRKDFARALYEAFHGPTPKGFDVDHINGDKADDRLSNLRAVSRRDNLRAFAAKRKNCSSRFRGVSKRFSKRKQVDRWISQIKAKDKIKWLGAFDHEVQAAFARDIEAIALGFPIEGTNFFKTVNKL